MMEDDGGVQEFQQKGQWQQYSDEDRKNEERKIGLALLRKDFPEHQISKLPKPTKKQTEDVRADYKKGIRCQICGAWHHPDVIHLDYVGHAALTDRLLDADANWCWEPLSIGPNGLPVIDGDGGMWIKLTVCGVTRLGYGDAQGKTGGDAMKERIGDALRNAAMRFGAALDLWHKGDLHLEEEKELDIDAIILSLENASDLETLKGHFTAAMTMCDAKYHHRITVAKDKRKAILEPKK